MSKTVEGTPVWLGCRTRNSLLEQKYKILEEKRANYIETIVDLQKKIEEIDMTIKELNRDEVNNVLDYVRSYARTAKISATEIDTLLCHCMNKLNGNIDSVFLKFDDPVANTKE